MDVDILPYVGKLVYFHGKALNSLCKILKILVLFFHPLHLGYSPMSRTSYGNMNDTSANVFVVVHPLQNTLANFASMFCLHV